MDHSRDHFNDSSRVDRNDLPELSELVFPSPSLTTRSSCSFELLKKVLFDEVEGQIVIFEECAEKVDRSRYCHTALSKVELFESLIGNELRANPMTPEIVGTVLRKFPLHEDNSQFYSVSKSRSNTSQKRTKIEVNADEPHDDVR